MFRKLTPFICFVVVWHLAFTSTILLGQPISPIYVDIECSGGNGSSWAQAFKYLQDALAAAGSGDEIWVAEGTYKPDQNGAYPGGTGSRSATFSLKSGVAIYGGFQGVTPPPTGLPNGETSLNQRNWVAHKTILSGNINTPEDSSDNSFHIVTCIGPNNEAILLDGFTITAGNANGGGEYHRGGGMYIKDDCPIVANCTFIANWAADRGGGMEVKGSPILTNCTFRENSTGDDGGGMYVWNGNVKLTDCTFSNNTAVESGQGSMYGGGMAIAKGSATLTDCSFVANSIISPTQSSFGGGLYAGNEASSIIATNCMFLGNSISSDTAYHCYGGGMMVAKCTNAILTNCLFSGNWVNIVDSKGWDWGGGLYVRPDNTKLTNCTFSRNSAGTGGGLFCGCGASCAGKVIVNCIFWDNTDEWGSIERQQVYTMGGGYTLSYSCIQGLDTFAGNSNIGDDPLFQDADGGDGQVGTEDDNLRLSICSPCIDAGDNSVVTVATDLDGNPRFVNDPGMSDTGNGISPIVDMGAYESQLVSSSIAWNPSPADGTECVELPVVLSWSPGCWAASHDVYLGTNCSDVNDATPWSDPCGVYVGQQDANNYILEDLEPCTTYCWRIDEVNAAPDYTIYKGDVWWFTTWCDDCEPNCVDPPEGMVAWWPLDETEGPTSEDIAGDNDGTWVGSPTPATGMVAGALRITGSRYVWVKDYSTLDFGTDDNFSMDCWVRTWETDRTAILDKREGTGSNPQGYILYLNDGDLALQLSDDTVGYSTYSSSMFVADGNWHHIAATVDRNDPNGVVLYVDGVPESFSTINLPGNLSNSADLWFGRDHFNIGSSLTGDIDEVELFNRALTESEIRDIFNAGSAGKCKPCQCGSWNPIQVTSWASLTESSTWTGSCGDTLTIPADQYAYGMSVTSSLDCILCPSSVAPTYRWEIKDPSGSVLSSGGGNQASFSPIQLGLFDVVLYATCDGVECTPCILHVEHSSESGCRIIDDMESYDNTCNLAAFTWQDGDGLPYSQYANQCGAAPYSGNGTDSRVGYDIWSSNYYSNNMETTTVHSGDQSLPFLDPNASCPRIDRYWLDDPQGWSAEGCLVLWHTALPTNECLYVGIGSPGNYHYVIRQQPGSATPIGGEWYQQCIPLSDFANNGVILSQVTRLSIGIGDPQNPQLDNGGYVFIDDIMVCDECPCD